MSEKFSNQNKIIKNMIDSFNLSINFDLTGYLEKEEEIYTKYPENFLIIDRFPMIISKSMEWFAPLDVCFSQNKQTPKEFFEVEKKFINTLTILSCYSSLLVQSSYYFSERKIPDFFTNEEKDYLLKMKDHPFIQIISPKELSNYLKLSLRGYEQTIIYLPELKIIAWVNELIVSVFVQDEKYRKLIDTISSTEGLYLREK
ncbi:hypothetical protein [Lysinibacillus sp. fls2-241-R2A-57]|uniref:hypothetical protein n=1 Tax=Lysinibacillus sp. fls2-241-R2A-57 TaxID=3040292 RepID=UPI0025533AE5|nr:hypothetical protein [Lysinibacillus sp. fls2-241-R2A-57]